MKTDIDVSIEILNDPPINADFYAVKGTKGDPGRDGHSPVITSEKEGVTTIISVDGEPIATIENGIDGVDGLPGKDGVDGSPGKDGKDGNPGADGHSPVITTSKSGKITTILSDGVPIGAVEDGDDGESGTDGKDGQDGYSPVITASKSGKHTTVYVDGSAIAQIDDGEDGQTGAKGESGQDGHSPAVTASKSGKITTVSVDGTPIATINDGEDGQNGNDGNDGYTPVKGTDYWTTSDKAEIVNDVLRNLVVETPSITDVVSTSHQLNTNQCHVEKIGRLVLLTVSVTTKSDVAAFGTIASIASGYRPVAQVWGRCFGLDFDITGGGNIRPIGGTFASGKTMQASIVYCTTA